MNVSLQGRAHGDVSLEPMNGMGLRDTFSMGSNSVHFGAGAHTIQKKYHPPKKTGDITGVSRRSQDHV